MANDQEETVSDRIQAALDDMEEQFVRGNQRLVNLDRKMAVSLFLLAVVATGFSELYDHSPNVWTKSLFVGATALVLVASLFGVWLWWRTVGQVWEDIKIPVVRLDKSEDDHITPREKGKL